MKTLVLAASAAALVAGSATAEVLLVVDLSVTNQVTITATTGASSATISGSDSTGVLLADFYSADQSSFVSDVLVSGDLTSVGDASDGTPAIYTIDEFGRGLNIWSWTNDDPTDFVSGSQAFTGSATWTIDADDYADMLAGNAGGDIYFAADDDTDIPGATVIGQWTSNVPEPGSLALLGLGGLAMLRRRR